MQDDSVWGFIGTKMKYAVKANLLPSSQRRDSYKI